MATKKAEIKKSTAQAVIKTGGKQYLVHEGLKLKIEKLEAEPGKKVVFEEVLLSTDGGKTVIGQPFIKAGTVEGTIVAHVRAKKVFGAKVKAKKRYVRYFGHKQHLTEVEITKISA